MGFANELKRLQKGNALTGALLNLFLLVGPGILYLYEFQHSFFVAIDPLKAVLISVGLVAPFCFINYILILDVEEKDPKDDEYHWWVLTLSIMYSGLMFYFALLVRLFWVPPSPIRFAYILCVLELAPMLENYRQSKKKAKVKTEVPPIVKSN